MEEILITSKNNVKIKQILGLRKKSRLRKEMGEFLIEGIREVEKAIAFGIVVKALFVDKNALTESDRSWLNKVGQGIEVVNCTPNVMEVIAYKDGGDKVIAIAKEKFLSKAEFFQRKKQKIPFYLLIEGVEKPGNFGAILRSADAVGVDGVVICDSPLDLYNPNVIRASLGTCFTVPIWRATSKEAFDVFRNMGCQIVVTTPAAEQSYLSYDYALPTVLVFGSEKDGVTSFWLEAPCFKAVIPMVGSVDSLNLAMSATLICYEVVRQRGL
ncbi:TrmH family RNA methyltransferase [Chlamydiifrater phoenicopteri]|uniref:TrmH family RNA methyltransferase n=1 Tax=Chlamydiifrater phoenicopteri TaxID=2681469 RepID=UPI001BCCFA85|nr:TrmH family RNA methyltransferase [Chlamydiifrater phoenicopteri]